MNEHIVIEVSRQTVIPGKPWGVTIRTMLGKSGNSVTTLYPRFQVRHRAEEAARCLYKEYIGEGWDCELILPHQRPAKIKKGVRHGS